MKAWAGKAWAGKAWAGKAWSGKAWAILGLRLVLGAMLLWLVGFAAFGVITHRASPLPSSADAIVVLTGAPGRIEAGLRLLSANPTSRLLISGVGPAVGFGELTRRAGLDPALASRITLGRLAHTTSGNAREAAAWARQRGFMALVVVTSSYHLPRALLEFARAMPDAVLIPAAVANPWPRDVVGWRLYVGEFNKYLAVLCRLGWLADRDDPGDVKGTG